MKTHRFSIKVPLLCIAVTALLAAIAHARDSGDNTSATIPSQLVEDGRGVLWVERGNDNRHPGDLAAGLSQRPPYFVIYVSTTDEYENRAIDHALNLAEWFNDQPDGPRNVPVVAFKSKHNTHFYFLVYGLKYNHTEHAPDGQMGPQATYKVREHAILDYQASGILWNEGKYKFMPIKTVTVVQNQDRSAEQRHP
ncbi:hypothetical protein [Cerasicoccus frondis]|uniref:hypothetical protein n=1 Tax=Cerasicoccus frondis TaxID=490090 RepID=UPI0028528BC9|nr:hypothetical protein [Cerasicoccus frondis]